MENVGIAAGVASICALIAGWLTHVFWIFELCTSGAAVTAGQVALMILGVVFPPVGTLHGIWLWF